MSVASFATAVTLLEIPATVVTLLATPATVETFDAIAATYCIAFVALVPSSMSASVAISAVTFASD
jgi:hypothetical protein